MVLNMILTEWNIEDAREVWREEAREEGWAEGMEKGREEGMHYVLGLFDQGLSPDEIRQRLTPSPQ